MAGILIIAHAPLAGALKCCLSHIYGELPTRIGAIDVVPDSDPAELLAVAHNELSGLIKDNGALVLTDLFGATPANIASHLIHLPQVRVLAGVNLPMLVRAVCYRTTPLEQLAEKALAGGANGIQAITMPSGPLPPTSSLSEFYQPEYHAATRNHHC